MSAVETFGERRERQAAEQAKVNACFALHGVQTTARLIRAFAYAEHAEHRQYDGFWSSPDWTLARCSTPLRSKGGLQADVGDVVLFRVERWAGCYDAEFYSVRLGWNCSASFGVSPILSRYTGTPVELEAVAR